MPQPPLPMPPVPNIIYQVLCGLQWIHSADIIHCDLKPQNILVKSGQVKICDFGLAGPAHHPAIPSTYSIASLWYRAPELIWKRHYSFVGT